MNTNTKEIHDLDHEDTSANGCQIDEIIAARHAYFFHTLGGAQSLGDDQCAKCMSESRR